MGKNCSSNALISPQLKGVAINSDILREEGLKNAHGVKKWKN
jgi:hypothetical protein